MRDCAAQGCMENRQGRGFSRMGAVFFMLLPLFLGACETLPAPSEARLDPALWEQAKDWESAAQAQEARFLKTPDARARRDASGLTLLLSNGRALRVVEDRACAQPARDVHRDCVRKYALYRFATRGYWLLGLKLAEGEAYALVDEQSGTETLLVGLPRFSPDGRHVAAVNKSAAGDTVNGIEVWRRDRDGLVLVFFHEEKGGAGYDFADWFDPATARLTWRGCVAKPEAACERPREAVLTGRGDKWRLVPWTR